MNKNRVSAWIAVGIIGVALGIMGARPADQAPEMSPHGAAVKLVIETQSAQIRAIDTGDWWLDMKERDWVVKRFASPGFFDSTHWFTVSYLIDGQKVASWFVDTRNGHVQNEPPAK